MSIKNVLCFAPHPDDEILGCGGSIAKALSMGHRVYMCYLSFGENGSPKYSPKKLAIIRKKEAMAVCRFLGILLKDVFFLSIPDNQISHHDMGSVKKIMKLVRVLKPDLVYLPHEREQSHDHVETNKLIMRALDMAGSNNFFQLGGCSWWVGNVLAYEVWTPLERYQYTEDISNFIHKKKKALEMYKSQTLEDGNVSNFIGNNGVHLSAYRAAMTLGEYRESFQVLRCESIYDS